MATTTPNFGWAVPTSSDLVKNGATAIETLGDSIDASLVDLKGGTTGQVLAKTSATDMDFTWTTPSAGGSSFVGALASTRATQTLSNNVQTAINLATETYDTNSFHSTTVNPSRFTIPSGKAGTYLFFATGGTDYYTGGLGIRFAKNGTNQGSAYFNFSSPASGLFVGSLTTVLSLAVGDYVELVMIQNSGSNKAVAYSGSEDFTFMGCTYLGA